MSNGSGPRAVATAVLDVREPQHAMYAGGPAELVRELLAADVVWHVPGRSAIAVYRLAGPNIAEAWLVPLDLAAFEEIWRRLARR